MKSKAILSFALCFCLNIIVCAEAWSFTINAPAPKARADAGSIVRVRVDASDAPPLSGVMFSAYGNYEKLLGAQFVANGPFEWSLLLPPDYSGPAVITARGVLRNGKEAAPPEAKVTFYVMLPGNVELQGITLSDNQKQFVMRSHASRKLLVYGKYSDGMERDISGESSGTTYTSMDKSVAVVDADGDVTARAAGKTQIIIKNGKYETAVNVTVLLK